MAYAGKLTYKTELDTSGVKKAGSTVKSIIAGLGITKLISSAMSTINASLDDAISRVDTLNNFPKVMSNLGVSAKDSSKSIQLMSDKLSGLPTTLDQGAMAVQRFTSKNGDVAKSTDIFLALNNAILAGGASTELQATALEQMSQAYAKGKPDMMEWRSIMSAMPAQLNQVAKAMGYGTNGADKLGEALRDGSVSMDEFMDAIIELNKKGIDGFQSFEKQARNSTAGIKTAVTVAKTQIVKGLADIVTGIDKGLKKSGTSINKIISNLGKKAKEVLDKIASALSKIDFEKIYNVLKKSVPVITSVVAGFVAYQGALKVISAINIAKNIVSATSALVGLTSATNLSAGAMKIFNSVMSMNPIALVTTAVVALGAGLVYLSTQTNQVDKDIAKTNSTLKEYNDSMKSIQKQKDEVLSQSTNEIYYYKSLADELKNITDENGKVQAGYEERANFIANELSDNLGLEIKLTDGIIENYGEIQDEIQKTIEKKKAMAYFTAHEEEYNEALKQESTLQKEIARNVDGRDKALKKINKNLANAVMYDQDLINYEEELKKYYQGEIEYADLTVQARAKVDNMRAEEKVALDYARQAYIKYNDALRDSNKTYADNQVIIDKYRRAEEQMAQGHYDAVQKIFNDTVTFNAKTKEANDKKYEQEKANNDAYLDYLKKNQEKYGEEFVKKEEERINKEQQLLEEEKEQANKQIEEKNQKILNTTIAGLNDQLKAMGLKNYEFRDAGNGNVQMYIDGQEQKKPIALNTARNIVSQVNKEYNNGQYGSEEAGKNLVQGLSNGMNGLSWLATRTATNIASNVLASMKRELQEQSPSKATKEMGKFLDEGLSLGIEDGEKDTLKAVNEFSNNVIDELNSSMDINKEIEDMYKEMNKTIQMENAKLNFNVMSNDTYNKSMQLPATIDLSANFEGTVPVQLNLDGEKIYDNQQKIAVRKSIQYGGVK